MIKIKPVKKFKGIITVPADKSISHRTVMFGSIAQGITRVKNFLTAEDCVRTRDAFIQMGIEINSKENCLEIHGKGLYGLKEPKKEIYCGNSGTTMRLLSGILAGQNFKTILTGDESLTRRPMARVAAPLRLMGAKILGDYPPLTIRGGRLKAINYDLPVASAQVKSCVLLAGLYADGVTSVTEPAASRDHTERMFKLFGVKLETKGHKISVKGGHELKAVDVEVPSDISSAAFFMVAASIVKNSKLVIKSVGLNPTRTGIIDVLKSMGADIKIKNKKNDFEPSADLAVEPALLKAITMKGDILPRLIDELPVIMIAATQAKGTTRIFGAKELRVKETDRIKSMTAGLKSMGADVIVDKDDIYIKGPVKLKGAQIKSFGDHRTAMSFAVAGLIAEGETVIDDTECILTSFPDFEKILRSMCKS